MHHLAHIRYNFDRGKPFYPIVMAYLMQLHGIKELSAIGILGTNRAWKLDGLDGTERTALLEEVEKKILGPLALAVTGDPERLTIPVTFVSQELVSSNYLYLVDYQLQAALNVLVMGHELTRDKSYRTNDEKWEFLRHCRNAAAHNGRWSLRNGEPRRPASWRGIKLRPEMHDQRLLKGPDGNGSLNLGDPVALLWELERDIPPQADAQPV